jgi:hypothetical protein
MLKSGTSPPIGKSRIVHRVGGAGARTAGRGREQGRQALAESQFLALEIAERRIDTELRQDGAAASLREIEHRGSNDENDAHDPEDGMALAALPDGRAESEDHGHGHDELRPNLEHIRKRTRVLEGVGRIHIEEAAAIVAQELDRLLARNRADCDQLPCAFERRCFDRSKESLGNAKRHHDDSDHNRQGQKQVKHGARHIDPEIADRRKLRSGEGAGDRESHCETGGGSEKVLDREPRHLGEMAHRRLAGIALPVGGGEKACRGVEGEVGRNGVEALRVERQKGL